MIDNNEIYYLDDIDNDYDYVPDLWDYELTELIIKRAIARQGPQYSEYRSCMWE